MIKVTITGYVSKDPELRSSKDGNIMCGFDVAATLYQTGNDGKKMVEYVSVTAHGAQAESALKFLRKGRKICVVGNGRTVSFKGRDEQWHAKLNVKATDIEFMNNKSDIENEVPDVRAQQRFEEPGGVPDGFMAVDSSELPF